jgi:hypothetical protein
LRDLVTPTLLESKDDMRKRVNRSPDLGDALALTFAIKLPAQRRRNLRPYTHAHEWNPFKEPEWQDS